MQIQTLSDVWNRSAQGERGHKGLKKNNLFQCNGQEQDNWRIKKNLGTERRVKGRKAHHRGGESSQC